MDEALRELRASPGVNMVLTDINLEEDQSRSGVALARRIQELRNDVPVAGYSAQRDDLPDTDKEVFKKFYPKGEGGRDAITQTAEDCKKLATEHRNNRLAYAQDRLPLLEDDVEEGVLFKTLRRVGLERVGQGAEAALNEAGFSIRLIEAKNFESIVAPFIVWLRTGSDQVEAEVYGQPELFSVGTDEEQAVLSLVNLMEAGYNPKRPDVPLSASCQEFLGRVVKH